MSVPEAIAFAIDPASGERSVTTALEDAVGWRSRFEVRSLDASLSRDERERQVLKGADRHFHLVCEEGVHLRPHGVLRMLQEAEGVGENVAAIHFPVWDRIFRRPLAGIALVRSAVAHEIGNPLGCDLGSGALADLAAAGLEVRRSPLPELNEAPAVVADRSPPDGAAAFEIARREVLRLDEPAADPWFAPHLHLLLEWHATSRDPQLLLAWAGLAQGLLEAGGGAAGLHAQLQRTLTDWRRQPDVSPWLEQWELGALSLQLSRAKVGREWQLAWNPAFEAPPPRRGLLGLLAGILRRIGRPGIRSPR